MRGILLIAFVICPLFLIAQDESSYTKLIQEYRDSVDAVFADSATSILLEEDLGNFSGLQYYPILPEYLIKARFRKFWFKKKFSMQTSTERLPTYRRFGMLKFEVNGQKVKLVLYQNLDYLEKFPRYDGLFCPFIDSSKHLQSYGGGRYLDFHIKEMAKWTWIDFNKSYNPYCAYNYRYSCPIPPKENHLEVNIPAGIQRWH